MINHKFYHLHSTHFFFRNFFIERLARIQRTCPRSSFLSRDTFLLLLSTFSFSIHKHTLMKLLLCFMSNSNFWLKIGFCVCKIISSNSVIIISSIISIINNYSITVFKEIQCKNCFFEIL